MHDGIASEAQDHVIRTEMQTSVTVKKSVLPSKWGKYNFSPAVHCARMMCLSISFSAAPRLYACLLSALIIVNAYFSSEAAIMHGY